MPYAVDTRVPASRTRQEIETLIVVKRKAKKFASMLADDSATIAFELNDRRLVFKLPLPKKGNEQDVRSRWRGLLLCLKAKFESIDRGVETFDQAFLSHVVMPDGRTVAEHVSEGVALAYAGKPVPLLPDYSGS